MDKTNKQTHADSRLTELFGSYFIYHKAHLDEPLNDETEITMAFYAALSGLDTEYSSKKFILSIKSDFDIISRVLEKIANQAHKDIRSKEGIRDKHSISETYYTVPEIEARWVITGTAVRKAIREQRLRSKEVNGRKNKYQILRADFERYAATNGIKLRADKLSVQKRM